MRQAFKGIRDNLKTETAWVEQLEIDRAGRKNSDKLCAEQIREGEVESLMGIAAIGVV